MARLSAGTRLGSHEIQSFIGAGGMGEVYRARDTHLKRDVAVKVLPEQFSKDPERMARFQREAQVLASLNHPNIAAIYGVENGALVMELVEGPAASGGKVETIVKDGFFASAQRLPDGKNLLVNERDTSRDFSSASVASLEVLNPGTGTKKILLNDTGPGWFAPTMGTDRGHLLFLRMGSLFAVPFDARRLELLGTPTLVIENVQIIGSSMGLFGFSDSGTLSYVPAVLGAVANSTLVWVSPQGVEQSVPTPPAGYNSVRLTADGARAAVLVQNSTGPTNQVWVADLERGPHLVVSPDGRHEEPIWTRDGRVVFSSSDSPQHRVILSIAGDGSGVTSTLLLATSEQIPSSEAADGTLIGDVNPRSRPVRNASLWLLPPAKGLNTTGTPQPFLDDRSAKFDAQFSPDGHCVAYVSTESGRPEIYIVPYPGPGAKTPVSTNGGTAPRWSRNGRQLFYHIGTGHSDVFYSVDVQTGPVLKVTVPKKLFEGDYLYSYDVAPDGRFLLIKRPPQSAERPVLHIVLNWFEELRRLAPVSAK